MLRIAPVNHRDHAVAERIHGIVSLAHAQEVGLMQVEQGPTLDKSSDDIVADDHFYIGAVLDGKLVGAVSLAHDDEPGQYLIALLVVDPGYQRQGVARALLLDVLRRGSKDVFAVVASASNVPALSLYRSFGFVPYKSGLIDGRLPSPVIKLRRPRSDPSASQRP